MDNIRIVVNIHGIYTRGFIPKKTSQLINDTNFVQDPNYVHTDNNYTNEDKERLSHYNQLTVLNGAVRYDITQNLTTEEKERAKQNLDIPADITEVNVRLESLEEFEEEQGFLNQSVDLRIGDVETTLLDLPAIKQDITNIEENVSDIEQNIIDINENLGTKIDINQGVENAGKLMTVGEDGNVLPIDPPDTTTSDNVTISKRLDGTFQAIGIRLDNDVVVTGQEIENRLDTLDDDLQSFRSSANIKFDNLENKDIEQDLIINDTKRRVDNLSSAGGYLTAVNFGVATPSQETLTNYAKVQIQVSDQLEIWNGTKVKNTFNGHTWVLTNTPDTIPAVFEWIDNGIDYINVATDLALGIVKGSTEELKISYDLFGEGTVNGLETILQNIDEDLADKENVSNKVITISSESTDTEYPTAKAVYDYINSLLNP